MNVRHKMIAKMDALKAVQISCINCKTCECCTFTSNSMKVTPLEAVELFSWLSHNERINPALKSKLESVVQHYRLDKDDFGNGKRSFIRRTYTCPFLIDGPKGCSIAPEAKPYGCLAFNPTQQASYLNFDCASELEFLREIDEVYGEKLIALNEQIKFELNLNWDKTYMPLGLLDLWQKPREQIYALATSTSLWAPQ